MSNRRASSKSAQASPPSAVPTTDGPKIDKSGLYDLQQVKRLLDDEVISVSFSPRCSFLQIGID